MRPAGTRGVVAFGFYLVMVTALRAGSRVGYGSEGLRLNYGSIGRLFCRLIKVCGGEG